ncbi:TetR/AcrR family transcriptional regulator [Tsukamurella pseudospumae]|uniref:HTH tetR-type domain-containing protein n=1 Tax=Tsukamurella pseudospumae TaxID=239498 RepID=A0A137YZD4_9ACTN|nr:TetR/AcrR family transcriptional regulator [Tsukamurella pseudospumae]KXO91304.1 hypothetical protein AXK61_07050 [Tsukamurella pseudospumae]
MPAAADALTDQVIAQISEAGLDGLSVRTVATRAGVSIGAVQHHFPTKAAMLRAALRTVAARAAERYRGAAEVDDVRQRLVALLVLLVPDDVGDDTARVWVAFSARALTDPEIGEVYRDLWSRLRSAIADLMAEAGIPVTDAQRRATAALALADGLTVDVLAGAIPVEEARAIIVGVV